MVRGTAGRGRGLRVGWRNAVKRHVDSRHPTAQVTDKLAEKFPEASGGTGSVVAQTSDGKAFTPAQEKAISKIITKATTINGIETIVDPFASEAERSKQAKDIKDGKAQIADAREQLTAGTTQLDDAEAQLNTGREQLRAGHQPGQGGRHIRAGQGPIRRTASPAGRRRRRAGEATRST